MPLMRYRSLAGHLYRQGTTSDHSPKKVRFAFFFMGTPKSVSFLGRGSTPKRISFLSEARKRNSAGRADDGQRQCPHGMSADGVNEKQN